MTMRIENRYSNPTNESTDDLAIKYRLCSESGLPFNCLRVVNGYLIPTAPLIQDTTKQGPIFYDLRDLELDDRTINTWRKLERGVNHLLNPSIPFCNLGSGNSRAAAEVYHAGQTLTKNLGNIGIVLPYGIELSPSGTYPKSVSLGPKHLVYNVWRPDSEYNGRTFKLTLTPPQGKPHVFHRVYRLSEEEIFNFNKENT